MNGDKLISLGVDCDRGAPTYNLRRRRTVVREFEDAKTTADKLQYLNRNTRIKYSNAAKSGK
jgi:hypothetical protein